ncbi:MAG: hypothetical protein SGILL_005801 [Bacillariaceae sp.]
MKTSQDTVSTSTEISTPSESKISGVSNVEKQHEEAKAEKKMPAKVATDRTQSSAAPKPIAVTSTAGTKESLIKNETAPTTSAGATMQKRRRRVNFSVMLVREAEKQNSRQPHISSEYKLQAGDIIVAIGDQDLSDMVFADACKVFSSKAVNVSDHLIRTKVVVARQRKSLISSSSAVLANPSGFLPLPTNLSMDFNPSEIALLANSIRAGLHSRSRMLGRAIPDIVWDEIATMFRMVSKLKNPAITNRSVDTLKRKWHELTRMKQYAIAEKARQTVSDTLREQFGEKQLPFSSLVEAHALRQAARGGPRPAKGCRCGREDHEYLFDPACLLYADIRKRLSAEELDQLLPKKDFKGKLSSKEKKALNAVNTANKTRILKLKELNEKENAENRFVAKMEEIQTKELKQAIFAPHLSSIVLSAICELQREFPLPEEEVQSDDEDEEDDEMDDDDDVPLVSLGKREAEAAGEINKKQQKIAHDDDPKISLEYVMRLFVYVSKTWGHCYREPSQLDYAWRWELFHGTYSSNQQWDAKSVCPRVENSLPFESIQFGLTAAKSTLQDVALLPDRIKQFEDSLLSGGLQDVSGPDSTSEANAEVKPVTDAVAANDLSLPTSASESTTGQLTVTPDILDQFCSAVHYLSPGGTGIYEEILALLKMEVVKVRSGIPVLTSDWFEKVDIMVLDDFGTCWSSDLDPEGKYCISEELRDTLEDKWVKYDYGWALADYPKELVFEYGVMDEWKESFEDRLEENENRSEGIGRFGL